MLKFTEMGLDPRILKVLEIMNIEVPSQIQQKAIPLMLADQDVIGQSQTGSGKTLAFAIPVVEKVKTESKKNQAIILCPTRELALQISEVFEALLGEYEGLHAVCLYGGEPINKQINQLKHGVQIIIGTPGRVLDHIRRKTIRLNSIQMVILDEADEMLNMGFKEDIEAILALTPEYRQTALFSATMPKAILEIARNFLTNPETIAIAGRDVSVQSIKQQYLEIEKPNKFNALLAILLQENPSVCMIFCNTKKMVDELTEKLLQNKIKAAGLHGDLSQADRTKIMNSFKAQRVNVLVCSDVAARGIDVNNVELVINYDIPNEREYYVHRIGRTGRAGKKGLAITLISGHSQLREFFEITRRIKANVVERDIPSSAALKTSLIASYAETLADDYQIPNVEDYQKVIDKLHELGLSDNDIMLKLIAKSLTLPEIKIEKVEKRKRSNIHSEQEVKEGTMTRIRLSLGRESHIKVAHIVCAIIEEAHLRSTEIGRVEICATYSLIDVPTASAPKVIEALNRCKINRNSAKARIYRLEK